MGLNSFCSEHAHSLRTENEPVKSRAQFVSRRVTVAESVPGALAKINVCAAFCTPGKNAPAKVMARHTYCIKRCAMRL